MSLALTRIECSNSCTSKSDIGSMVWPSGKQLKGAQYTVERVLGEGGFGITYLAHDRSGTQVVIKTLNDELRQHPDFYEFQQNFLTEANRLKRCTHPHIVKVYGVFEEESNYLCMVMEYIEGESLLDRIRLGTLSETEALRYISQVGGALDYIHHLQPSMLHRDVNPRNIMLRGSTGDAVLIDFGIAREFTPNLTQTHTKFYSDGYAPLEQYLSREKRGAYTDVYALAATMYVLLTKQLPPPALIRAAGEPIKSPKQWNPSISTHVNFAIMKGLELRWQDRCQSVTEWLKLLEPKSSIVKSPDWQPKINERTQKLSRRLNWLSISLITGFIGLYLLIKGDFSAIANTLNSAKEVIFSPVIRYYLLIPLNLFLLGLVPGIAELTIACACLAFVVCGLAGLMGMPDAHIPVIFGLTCIIFTGLGCFVRQKLFEYFRR